MSDPAIQSPSGGGTAIWLVVAIIVLSLVAVVFFGLGIVEEFRASQENTSLQTLETDAASPPRLP